MKSRMQIHDLLSKLLGEKVRLYFQPPEKSKMQYPCVLYSLSDLPDKKADNITYKKMDKYMLTVISINPDSDIPEKIRNLPRCRFEKFYTADNLNHWTFVITVNYKED